MPSLLRYLLGSGFVRMDQPELALGEPYEANAAAHAVVGEKPNGIE